MSKTLEIFWIWIDIDGNGEKWHLAYLTKDGEESMIHYPLDDFEDYWYGDEREDGEIVRIEQPAPLG